MNEEVIIDAVIMLPVIRNIEMPEHNKRASIRAQLPYVLKKILYSHDWDFGQDETTSTSVVDQEHYILRGKADNARSIINIRYGTNLELLDYRRPVDLDEWLDGRSLTKVMIWSNAGKETGAPRVRLVGTPSASSETIKYRYRKKAITLAEFPDDFSLVVESGLVARLLPAYRQIFEDDMDDIISMYDFGGGEDDPVKQDPMVVRRNNVRARKFGWS